MADQFDLYVSGRPKVRPMIYAYQDHFPEHKGLLKVGYTEIDVDKRVAQQMENVKAPTKDKTYEIVLREPALYDDGTSFTDKAVHHVLERKGFHALNHSEWFRCSVDDVRAAIIAVKTHSLNLENRTQRFAMRPEQEDAVSRTKAYFEAEEKRHPGYAPKFLWNAKMRFGKTFASYQLAKAMGMQKVLVLTFKPAVESAWEEDLMTHVDFEGWQFYSREAAALNGKRPEDLDQTRPIVCFGSFQDFLGTNDAGGIKPRNEWVHTTNWDLVIFDEYHYGAWRENAKKLFEKEDEDTSYDALDIEKYKKNEADNAYNESFLPITTKYYLYLSGTPFRALNSGEFIEDQIYNWTYTDEQKAKASWNGPGPNPYAALPKMILMTYRIPDSIRSIAYNEQFNEFDLNVFFSAKVEDGQPVSSAQFTYKEYVQKWLDLIRGAYMPTTVDNLKLGQGQKPVMPYSDVRLLDVLNHTFWFLPNVAACYAMKNLLEEKKNVFYHQYAVNVCAGASAGIGLDALGPVKASMDPALETKTITLSCGKLTTGVTIRPWAGILMLRNLSSPETYFQAAFRVQSPWEIIKENGTKEIMKQECYIFDFALDRALRQISDYSCRLNIDESNPEKKVGEFINFLPVLAYDGATMKAVSATDILDIAMAGTSATLLARRWESALLVNVDNGTLQRILDNPDALKALMSIEGFRSLNKDIQTIINKSNEVKKAKKEGGENLSKEEKKQLSEEEKEYKSKRKQIQEKLIKFATRVPIFMYLTDFREHSLKDVITQFEPGLFKKVTGLDVKDFELLVSLGVFNDTLMNEAVYKFKRYEDSSLEYSGLYMHAQDEDVGLFSTVISREDYENMEKLRSSSMSAPVKNEATPIVQISKKPVQKVPVVTQTPSKTAAIVQPISTVPEPAKDEPPIVYEGMRIEHNRFGKGTVVGQSSASTVTVKFDEGGEKTFGYPMAFDKGFMWEVK